MANFCEHQAPDRSCQRVYMVYLWFRDDSDWNVA